MRYFLAMSVSSLCLAADPCITVDGIALLYPPPKSVVLEPIGGENGIETLLDLSQDGLIRIPEARSADDLHLENQGLVLVLEEADGVKRPVLAHLVPGRSAVLVPSRGRDPIEGPNLLSPEEMQALWGLLIRGWSEKVDAALRGVDLSNVAVTIAGSVHERDVDAMVRLLVRARFLKFIVRWSEHSDGLDGSDAFIEACLRGANPRYLQIEFDPMRDFDVRSLSGSKWVQYLALRHARLRNAEDLGLLTGLQELDLRGSEGFSDLSFVRLLKSLRALNVGETKVVDLRPVGELERLASIGANECPIRFLPEVSMPALQILEVFQSGDRVANLASFAARNPRTTILFRQKDLLVYRVQDANRVRVLTGGKVLSDVFDEAEVDRMLEMIDTSEGPMCISCSPAEWFIEFRKGERLLCVLEVTRELSPLPDLFVRCYLWHFRVPLTKKSSAALIDWITEKMKKLDDSGKAQKGL